MYLASCDLLWRVNLDRKFKGNKKTFFSKGTLRRKLTGEKVSVFFLCQNKALKWNSMTQKQDAWMRLHTSWLWGWGHHTLCHWVPVSTCLGYCPFTTSRRLGAYSRSLSLNLGEVQQELCTYKLAYPQKGILSCHSHIRWAGRASSTKDERTAQSSTLCSTTFRSWDSVLLTLCCKIKNKTRKNRKGI